MIHDISLNNFQALTLSTLQTQINTCENSVNIDDTVRNEPSHLDLHCLLFCF